MGFWDGSDSSWTICKQSAPRSRQITTPTPHHSSFTGRMLFMTPRRQVSKHYSCGAPVDLKVHESYRACLSYTDADAGYCSWLRRSTHSTSPSATLMMRCTHDGVMPRPRRHALTGPPPPLLLTAVMMVAVVCTYVRMSVDILFTSCQSSDHARC